MMNKSTTTYSNVISAFLILFFSFSAFAVAPSDDVIEKWKREGSLNNNLTILDNFRKNGGCLPAEHAIKLRPDRLALDAKAVDTVRVIVLLVDFLDYDYTGQSKAGTAADFDSILFSNRDLDAVINPTGSMTDFYLENSYNQFYVVGDIVGWITLPANYSTYADGDYGLGGGARQLVDDAITYADAAPYNVDYSQYDHDNDGQCDGIIVIHAGPGGETTGDVNNIWSHKWSIPTPRSLDGVWVSNYTINPEEYVGVLSPIGVFCHEYGHFLGLPDLYDTSDDTDSSNGLGRWSLMASGNYNGDSKLPAHFDAWCKSEIGFLSLTALSLTGTNLFNAAIPQVESDAIAYKLQDPFYPSQYWLVENRQKTRFDAGLPGEGLCIYHVDETKIDNTDPYAYLVALEQADGLNQLAFGNANRGDVGDPYPGQFNNRNFHQFTTPNSKTNAGTVTQVGVWNISSSDSIMYADLDYKYSRAWIALGTSDSLVFDDSFNGDGDGLLEPGETVRFYFSVRNLMKAAHNVHAKLTSQNGGIVFTQDSVTILGDFIPMNFSNASAPLEFVLPDTISPMIDSFFLTISTDSVGGIAGGEYYTETFGFETTLGTPNILIVDSDRGSAYEQEYINALHTKRLPAEVWNKQTSGTPAVDDMTPYYIVLWHTGDTSAAAISAADLNVMKEYMDAGGNLMLSSVTGPQILDNLDSSFMANYFQAAYDGTSLTPELKGITGNAISDNTKYIYQTTKFRTSQALTVLSQGEPVFTDFNLTKICGVAYSGSTFKSVLLGFPVEFIDDNRVTHDKKATLVGRVIDFFGGVPTDVYDGSPFVQLPQSFDLNQNYPNPFNPATRISYTLRAAGKIGQRPSKTNLAIFNILGQKVRTLVHEVQIPGVYQVDWDGKDGESRQVASGIYFYRLSRGEEAETKKMMLVR